MSAVILHTAAPREGTRVGTHAWCEHCDRIIELAPSPGSRLGKPNHPYWRHHSQPTSTMIPAAVRLRKVPERCCRYCGDPMPEGMPPAACAMRGDGESELCEVQV